MVSLSAFDELSPGFGFPSIKDKISDKACEEKNLILEYMKNGKITIVTASQVVDIFTHEKCGEKYCMSDDEYSWSTAVIYYFEKYNLELPKCFIEHVIKKIKSFDKAS